MNSAILSRPACNALRGLAIIGIFMHNYCHWLGPIVKENEYQYFQHNVDWLNQVMVSMDSANMHLASLVHTPVVSIWGATHPYAGFMGWNQNHTNAVQVDLPCRPCSIYGNKPCMRGDMACMNQIKTEDIIQRIIKVIQVKATRES